MLNRGWLIAAAMAGAGFAAFAGTPAYAGFGAVAIDESTGKYGASWNETTQSRAFELALKQCDSKECRVHAVEPKGCGALAMSDKDEAGHIYWGGADREKLNEAKHEALAH